MPNKDTDQPFLTTFLENACHCSVKEGTRGSSKSLPRQLFWLMFFLSELVGPWQDIERTGCGGDRDVAAEEEVLLLRPERGLQRPRPAQPALRTGTQTNDIELITAFPDFVCWLASASFSPVKTMYFL